MPRENTIIRRVRELRDMLAAYQKQVGAQNAESLGERISPLAADIEDLQSGIELNNETDTNHEQH